MSTRHHTTRVRGKFEARGPGPRQRAQRANATTLQGVVRRTYLSPYVTGQARPQPGGQVENARARRRRILLHGTRGTRECESSDLRLSPVRTHSSHYSKLFEHRIRSCKFDQRHSGTRPGTKFAKRNGTDHTRDPTGRTAHPCRVGVRRRAPAVPRWVPAVHILYVSLSLYASNHPDPCGSPRTA